MRAAALALVALALAFAGCTQILDGPEPPPPVTTTLSGAMVFRADGEKVVPVPLPAAFGQGFRVASVATGFAGAEPNIGITSQGSVYVSAYESILRSRDGGATWNEVHQMTIGQTYDPMLWVDAAGGRVFSTHIYPDKTCHTLIYSDNPDAEDPTWTELPLRCPSPVVDHQKIATGPFAGPVASAAAALPYPRLVSLCYNKLSATHCAVSLDGGITYPIDTQVDATPGSPLALPGGPASCGGLTGHQTHALDGTIFLPYGYGCVEARVAVSTDGGMTWTRRDLDADQLELDPEVAVTPDGTAYYLYRGSDQALHLLRSRDRFATTQGPYRVSPPEVQGTVFAGLAAGSDGRIALAYLGTTDSDQGPDDARAATEWHLYAAMSLDADAEAPTFVTVRVTPADDPVQRGSICHSKACRDGNRNLLDFIDLSAGPDGRFWVSYADGCTSDRCLTPNQLNQQTSRDDTAYVAWLMEGPSLLEARGRLAPP